MDTSQKQAALEIIRCIIEQETLLAHSCRLIDTEYLSEIMPDLIPVLAIVMQTDEDECRELVEEVLELTKSYSDTEETARIIWEVLSLNLTYGQ